MFLSTQPEIIYVSTENNYKCMKKNNSTDNNLSVKVPIRHFLLIMRATVFLLFVCVFCSMAETGFTQNARVTINKRNVAIKEILNEIESQTDYLFIYNNEVNTNEKVSIKANHKAVSSVLNSLLKNKDLEYSMEGNHIILSTIEKAIEKEITDNAAQQQKKREITGTVVDAAGLPIIGANVIEKGTTNGTVTDVDGKFTISVDDNAIIHVSYIGYLNQKINTTGKTNFEIILKEDTEVLEELVVVGYGTQKKVNLTGSVASIDTKYIESRPITSVSAGLAGLLPGVSVRQQSGLPGGDEGIIRVRGVGTLNNASPMILIDGVEGSMNDVQANDIANISVLKDAASSAIYGSKAANGVILITTRSGKTGKPIVSYMGDFGWQSPTRLPDYLGSADYAVLYNEALANSGKKPKFTENDIELFRNGSDPFGHPDTDWLDLLYSGSGFLTTNNISISGGNEYSKYRASVNYQEQGGIIKYTDKKEYNGRANLTMTPQKWITTNLNLSYTQMDRKEPNNAYVGGGLDQIIRQASRISPWIPYKNEDGTYGTISDGNPIAWIDQGAQMFEKRKTFVGIGSIQLDLFNGFNVKAIVSHRNVDTDKKEMNKEIQYNQNKYHGPTKLTLKVYNNTRNTFDLTMNYNKVLHNVHNLGLLAGYHTESYDYKYTMAYRERFPSTELTDLNGGSTAGMKNEGYTRDLNMTSLFGRMNYDYMGKYLLEGNIRFDKSSRFAKDNRRGIFPSFSAGWRVSEEPFFSKAREFFNNMKIRTSWGILGNQDALDDYYPTVPTLTLGKDYPFNSAINSGAAIVYAKNSELLWEKTTSYGIGLDATFLNKFNITVDVYKKMTQDIIMQVPAPLEFALEKFYDNVGKVHNKGIEISVDYNNKFREVDFRFGGNFAYNQNKLRQLAGTKEIIDGRKIRRLGKSLDSWFGYQTDGLFQSVEEIAAWPVNTMYSKVMRPGDLKYVNQNEDNVIDAEDRVVLGNSIPTMNYGFNISVGYKNFDIMALFQGALGAYGYMDRDAVGAVNGDSQKPSSLFLDRWNENNKNTTVPRVIG